MAVIRKRDDWCMGLSAGRGSNEMWFSILKVELTIFADDFEHE